VNYQLVPSQMPFPKLSWLTQLTNWMVSLLVVQGTSLFDLTR
jgi:hypothetical protein